ncbi:DsbA family protein [Paracidovorax citrulli]
MEKVLHYIHDPLCGWCYAAESLAEAASGEARGQFVMRLHAGGLFARTHLSSATRNHIRIADARIGELTGQVFSDAYLSGLLGDRDTVYDSAMPIRGILAAEAVQPGSGLAMLKALQHAHYRGGRRIVEMETIVDVAQRLGLEAEPFAAAFKKVGEGELEKHLASTHRLMHEVGGRGYPTFVAQVGNRFEVLPHDPFYGDAQAFAELVSAVYASPDARRELQ